MKVEAEFGMMQGPPEAGEAGTEPPEGAWPS